jgi:hypothetical protein
MITVAVASKARHWAWWQSLAACGLPLSSSWPWWKFNSDKASTPSPDDWRDRWEKNIADAAAADILLFLDLEGENQCGGLIELGAALAAGKQVFIVSKNFWSVEHHRRVRKFDDLESAIRAIKAKQAGTAARAAA